VWKNPNYDGGHCCLVTPADKAGDYTMSLGREKDANAIIQALKQSKKNPTSRTFRALVILWPMDDADLVHLPRITAACPWITVFIFWAQDGHRRDGFFERTEELKELESERLDEIESEAIDWIDIGYLPRGMTVTFFAPKGRGKTKICDWFTARATKRGEIVIRFNLEDPVESVLKPALYAAGADLKKVIWIKPQPIDLSQPLGIAAVKAKIVKEKATLVIFEPMNNYKGSAKSISEDDMRPIYMALSAIAKDTLTN